MYKTFVTNIFVLKNFLRPNRLRNFPTAKFLPPCKIIVCIDQTRARVSYQQDQSKAKESAAASARQKRNVTQPTVKVDASLLYCDHNTGRSVQVYSSAT